MAQFFLACLVCEGPHYQSKKAEPFKSWRPKLLCQFAQRLSKCSQSHLVLDVE